MWMLGSNPRSCEKVVSDPVILTTESSVDPNVLFKKLVNLTRKAKKIFPPLVYLLHLCL